MAESTLSLKKRDYEVEVGDFLGYGRDPTKWGDTRTEHINAIVKAGLSNYYFPDLGGQTYHWSFLKPVGSFSLASGAQELTLPDDFNGFTEPFLVIFDSTKAYRKVWVGNLVRSLYASQPEATGHPQHAEVGIVEGRTAEGSSRYKLLVFPEADAAYTLKGRYSLAPHALSGARPYVYGNVAHHQTVLESCLAAAEQRRDNEIGLHSQLFKDKLRASVSEDRKMAPKYLGYNGDGSSGRNRRREPGADWNTLTLDGVTPE